VKIIVGLGNPGARYQRSRHNVGFQVVDRLAEIQHIPIGFKRFKALYGTGYIDSQDVVLVKPLTFMNLSGEAVRRVTHAFRAGMEDLVIIHDDLDLRVGSLRIKRRGGDGGHQGVRSIIDALGGNTFMRLKVGIGRPPEGMDPAEYVLKSFDPGERPQIDSVLSQAAEALMVMLSDGVEAAMNRFQRRASPLFRSP
jgi:peptidyl-tRNA hydrolase, PTH1 family